MQAIAGHDVGLSTEDTSGVRLHIHQFKNAELSFFVIEKQINVGIFICLAARGRAEHVEMFDTESFQVSLMIFNRLMASSRFI